MSRAQVSQRSFFPFGNPFRMFSPKGSISSDLLALLNGFEENFARRVKNLKPADGKDVLSLLWMKSAMESLSAIHSDVKDFITALEFPVDDWDEKWIDVYFNDSVKLLDICNAFSSHISQMQHGHLFLQCMLHDLDRAHSELLLRTRSSVDGWKRHISSWNPKLVTCLSAMVGLAESLDLAKVKNSAKGKVLMRAMYGLKVVTLFICSIFAAVFSGSKIKMVDLQVPEECLWADVFTDLQTSVNAAIRNVSSGGKIKVVKELEAVDMVVDEIYPVVEGGLDDPVEAMLLPELKMEFKTSAAKLSEGLELLAREVDNFFQVLLTGRNALLCNFSFGANVLGSNMQTSNGVEGRVVG